VRLITLFHHRAELVDQVWGITIGGAILQNGLRRRIPSFLLAELPVHSSSVAYDAIPLISKLPIEQRLQVQDAFARSLNDVWKAMAGIAGLGLLASLPMKALPLHTAVASEDPSKPLENGKSSISVYSVRARVTHLLSTDQDETKAA
jgi:hypothetical protein